MKTKPTNQTKSLQLMTFFANAVCMTALLCTHEVKASHVLCKNFETVITQNPVKNITDSITARRDEYFKDIQIVIDDKPAGVFIDKPYKKLTLEEKEHYLSYIPEKKTKEVMNESDYNSFINKPDVVLLLDNKITTKEHLLKFKREDFAGGGSKRNDAYKQYFFYTHAYFNKHIKPIYDHYPNKVYKITILNEAVEYQPDFASEPVKKTYQRNGTEDKGYKVAVSYMSYGYTDELKSRASNIYTHFPGGNDKFAEYLFKNLQMPYQPEKLQVSYTVNTDGTLSDIHMSEDTDPLLLMEVQRVMLGSPRWIPEQVQGKPQVIGTRENFKNKLK